MKKILFNDKFNLTQAVLEGRKTQTRRIAKFSDIDAKYLYDEGWEVGGYVLETLIARYAKYKLGKEVAVAQSYKDCGYDPNSHQIWTDKGVIIFENSSISQLAGWTNKLFVHAALMLHRIHITDVRVERLNDISDSGCIAEGIYLHTDGYYSFTNSKMGYDTPREAYAALIDKISGRGTFKSNPYVFAYTFELVK